MLEWETFSIMKNVHFLLLMRMKLCFGVFGLGNIHNFKYLSQAKAWCVEETPRVRAHTLHPEQTVCILSASQPLCTMQQNIQKTKGSTEGENEKTDQTISSTTREGVCRVCVRARVRARAFVEQGDGKARGGRGGDEDKCREGERQRAAEERKTEGEIKFART